MSSNRQKSSVDPLSLAKVFVRTVVRMFYDIEHMVIIDALVYHGALLLQDLVLILDWGKNQKGASKLTGKLKEAGLISVYSRLETREGALKAVLKDYYYIDYRRAIDSTKYKLHILDSRIKAEAAPTQEKKELQCNQCKAQWTVIEVMDNPDPEGRESGFLCRQCDFPLMEISQEGETLDQGDLPAKFNKYFGPLLKLMQQIDEVVIPQVEGADALAGAIEVPRDKEVNPAAKHEAVQAPNARPTAVKGMQSVAPEKIEVSIATDADYTEANWAAEQEKAAKIAAQNQLPDWHTKSTIVEKESMGDAQNIKTETNGVNTPTIKAELVEDKKVKEKDLDDVFAQIEKEQREKEAEESEDEEDEDDEDEFEDVIVPTPSGLPDAKRVKLETSAAPSPANATPAASMGDGGDESDEDEFVDV